MGTSKSSDAPAIERRGDAVAPRSHLLPRSHHFNMSPPSSRYMNLRCRSKLEAYRGLGCQCWLFEHIGLQGFRLQASGFRNSGQGLVLGGTDASSTTSSPFQPDPSGFSSNRATSNKFRKLTLAPEGCQFMARSGSPQCSRITLRVAFFKSKAAFQSEPSGCMGLPINTRTVPR